MKNENKLIKKYTDVKSYFVCHVAPSHGGKAVIIYQGDLKKYILLYLFFPFCDITTASLSQKKLTKIGYLHKYCVASFDF